MSFGKILKTLRNEKGLNQTELGKVINVGKTTISGYENDSSFPDKETLRTIADFFDVSIDYLLGRTNIRNYQLNPFNIKVDPETLLVFNRASKELPPDALQRLKEYAAREIEYELMKREREKDKK